MEPLRIKGLNIGTGRPKAIVSLMAGTSQALVRSAQEAVSAGAECLEWRADFFDKIDDLELLSATCKELMAALPRTPLVFTFRTLSQGGQRELSVDAYETLVRAIVRDGNPDLVDIELGIGDDRVRALVAEAHAAGAYAIVSHHDFQATPPTHDMHQLLLHMATLGADIPKLAVMPHSVQDALCLMEATTQAANELTTPLLTMAMGGPGKLTRLLGESFGSALTFCALGTPSAPGQVALGDALSLMDQLHALTQDA